MLRISALKYSDSGKKLDYVYDYDDKISKFFNSKESFYCHYDIDVSKVPESIAIIPFLANILPIAWFAGFSIELNEIDEEFMLALDHIKTEFIKKHPSIDFYRTKIHAKRILKNNYPAKRSSMLFSGGVDAYATYFRHHQSPLDLITIHGADVEIEDTIQWERVLELNETEELLDTNRKHYIKSNLKTFYKPHVELLLPYPGWWGKVQHGLALNAIVAPLSVINGYRINYIASSYTEDIDIAWGSTPELDNNIKWGNTKIIHDGYELKREEKIGWIVNTAKNLSKPINIRVCYSLLNRSVNCSKCEKCYRTIIALILNNVNPNKYGFDIDIKIYNQVLTKLNNGFSSKGEEYFWWEILEKIELNTAFYIFSDKAREVEKMIELHELIEENIITGLKVLPRFYNIKFRIQTLLPSLFKIYLKFRQRKL